MDEHELPWQEYLRLVSCHAWQQASELIESGGDQQSVKIATALIKTTAAADLGHSNDPKIWAAYQAGFLATAVVKDPKGKALFDRLGEIEAIDVGRVRGGKSRERWTLAVDSRARDILKSLPSSMSEDAKAKRVKAKLHDDNGKPFGLTAIKQHLFAS
jgi:hypothetical protein